MNATVNKVPYLVVVDPCGIRDPDSLRAASLGQEQSTEVVCPSAGDSLDRGNGFDLLGRRIEDQFSSIRQQASMPEQRQVLVVVRRAL